MNLKIANLVAIQFGIFIGIMSWLAYSRFESTNPPRTTPEVAESRRAPVATTGPVSELRNQRPDTVDSSADREQVQSVSEQPAPAAHQYSAEAVQKYAALATQQYYQQIAPRRHASSAIESGPIARDSRSYAEVAQERASVLPDYADSPQTVAYSEPAQVIVYQPQFIVFANQRRFANRCRPALQPAAVTPMAHRGPGRGGPHLSGSTESRPTKCLGTVPSRNPNDPSCRPSQGDRSRGRR